MEIRNWADIRDSFVNLKNDEDLVFTHNLDQRMHDEASPGQKLRLATYFANCLPNWCFEAEAYKNKNVSLTFPNVRNYDFSNILRQTLSDEAKFFEWIWKLLTSSKDVELWYSLLEADWMSVAGSGLLSAIKVRTLMSNRKS